LGLFDGLMPGGTPPTEGPKDKELVEFVRKKIEEVRRNSVRVSHEGIWMTNIAYLCGINNVYYDTSARQYRNVDRGVGYLPRNRFHINKILPTIQNRLARLTKSRPKYQVRPQSNDQEDKDSSRLAEQVLDMIWEKEEIAQKQIDLFMWLQQCGHSYLKTSWDPTLGKLITDPMTGAVDYEGDIRIDVVSAFEVFPDPLAKNFRDVSWIVQAKVRKLDYFKLNYPEKGDQVKEEDTWLLSSQYENRINSLTANTPSSAGTQQNIKNTAIEMVLYERRSQKYPEGRMIVCANGVLLEDKPLPCGEIPFIKFDDIIVGGKYYSESIITHLRPIQDQYNRVMTKRAQWISKLLAGKYIAARGSELIEEALNDQSGEVIYHTPVPNGEPPTALQIPQIPSYAYKEEESLEAQFNDVSGINEVSRGQSPGQGITAAIALQYLSEQDDTRIGIMSRRHELGMARFGRLILLYIEKFYQTPRLLKIAGQNMEYLVKEFQGADLKGNTDVTVVEGSTLPGSITAKRDLILQLRREGLLGDPSDPKANEKVLKFIEYGDVADIWEDHSVDMAQIKRSIDTIEAGEMPDAPNELDNNELHIQEKNRLRKTDKFHSLSPLSQELLLQDIEARLQLIIQRDNPQLPLVQQQADHAQQQAAEASQVADLHASQEPILPDQMATSPQPQEMAGM
jgi:hypothetical protein